MIVSADALQSFFFCLFVLNLALLQEFLTTKKCLFILIKKHLKDAFSFLYEYQSM